LKQQYGNHQNNTAKIIQDTTKKIMKIISILLLACYAIAAVSAQNQQAEQQPIILNVDGVGQMQCNANQEPADVVLAFARRAASAGVNMNIESMNGMLKYFCDKRQCTKNLPQTTELSVDGVGKLVCPPWREPASLVEEFASQAAGQGLAINQASMNQMMQFFCQRTVCFRNVASPIKLDVNGIGSLTVQPWQEPADMVEAFASQAVQNGMDVSGEGMKQMMEYFCSRRECRRLSLQMPQRQQAQPITLNVEGVGSMTVQSNQDPADVVESFAAQATEAGVAITGESMIKMMEYFCSRRQCNRMQIRPPQVQQQAMGGMAGSKMAQQQQQYGMGSAGLAAAANPATFDEPLVLRL
jgi:hypothetical protein